jgi:hypothetical protein
VPRIEDDESFDLVRKDVQSSFGAVFGARDDIDEDEVFTVVEPFRGEEAVRTANVASVPWTFRCRHTGDFNGIFPTGRNLDIQGVTLVDFRGGEPLLSRYIDWAGVIAQLGLTVSARVPVTEEEYQFGRERLGLDH